MRVRVLGPTSGLPASREPSPLPEGLGPAAAVGAFLGPHRGVSLLTSPCLLPPGRNLGHFAAGFMAEPDRSCRVFCLRTEVTLRFMGAINPHPISALIEAICIVTKIIRDNFIGIFKKIIISHIFKLCNSSDNLAGLPRTPA